jgi:hypothetical protein
MYSSPFNRKVYRGFTSAKSAAERAENFVVFIVYNFYQKCLNQPSPSFSRPEKVRPFSLD